MCLLNAPAKTLITFHHYLICLGPVFSFFLSFFSFFFFFFFWEGVQWKKRYGDNVGVSNWIVHILNIEILEQPNLSFHLFEWIRCSLSFKRYFEFPLEGQFPCLEESVLNNSLPTVLTVWWTKLLCGGLKGKLGYKNSGSVLWDAATFRLFVV